MPASVVFRETNEKPDGSRSEMICWSVPVSEEYPEGIKYSSQYMNADGATLLRFDNARHHPDIGRHHRHTPMGDVEPIEYSGLGDLVDRFLTEVNALYERRTDCT